MNVDKLKEKARSIRLQVLDSVYKAGKGHLGGTYSSIELLVALYYGKILNFKSKDSKWINRDRFILSKGHACLALYAIFLDLKMISKKIYDSYGKSGGLGGQLDTNTSGVDFNTGSLGHSIGVGAGMALAAKLNKQNYRVFQIIGDAEIFEGSVWEAIIFASEHNLNNLICVIDRNRLMVTDVLEDEGVYKDFSKKIASFGWEYFEIDGHDLKQILEVYEKSKSSKKPIMIVANTIKGKGVSFMENVAKWHHGAVNKEQYEQARRELEIT